MSAISRVKRTSGRISGRGRREDGDTTRARIIEAAGSLFAEYGYADATSKQVCEAAGVNISAVNYHFGSREGLEEAVLEAMRDYMTSPAFLVELREGNMPANEALRALITNMMRFILGSDSWQVGLWLREVTSPSECMVRTMRQKNSPRNSICELLSRVTGKAMDDPMLQLCFTFVTAPLVALLIARKKGRVPLAGVLELGAQTVADELAELIFSGLSSRSRGDEEPGAQAASFAEAPE